MFQKIPLPRLSFFYFSQTNYMPSRSRWRDPIDNRRNNAAGLSAVSFHRLVLPTHVDTFFLPLFLVLEIHPRKNGGNHTWEGNCRTWSSDAVVRAHTYDVHTALKARERRGGARYEGNIWARIGPVQTSLRPKANRSDHEKHERKVKGRRRWGREGDRWWCGGPGRRSPVEAPRPSVTG